MSSQTPHIQRLLLAAFVTGIPEHKVRCISPDVGGAFGSKIFCYADMALTMFASKAIGGRPVKWVESRRENYQSTIHGRDHITYLEIAGKRDGEITGLRVKTLANLGGRLSTIGPGIPTTLYARVLSGCYKIPNVYAEVTGVYTNTTFVDAYRGAGRPEATYVIERAMDLFAAEIGMDRAEIRRRNFIAPDKFPYENPSGLGTASGGAKIYIDSGNYEPALDKALAIAGYADLAAKKAEARTRGKYLGLGLSTYIEVCGVAPSKWIGAVGEGWGAAMWESANIKMHLTGKTVVTMGTQPQGQGHETTYSQIVSHELGIPMEDIVVQHSDTQGTPFGYGSYGSRTSSGVRQRSRRPRRSARRRAGWPPTCSRPPSTTSRSTARTTSSRAVPTGSRRSRRSPSRSTSRSIRRRAWSPTSTRPPITTPRTARGRSGRISRSSRSTRRRVTSTSSATSRSMTSARRSTR
jgi:carbon-monoxide dehydrogenase large subunit